MRAQAIKTLTEKTGDADMAAAVWEMFVKHAFAGREPSEAMFKMLDKDESLAAMPVGFRKPLAALWPDASPEPAKGRKFKVEKARQYTHEEIAAFVAADPKGATEGLAAETLRRTGGQPFRLIVDGKLDIAETAKRINALKERDPVAPFVIIGGKEITPVGFEIDAAKEDAEDPYLRGEPLGQPGDVSNYLGMSLAKVSHETRQAIDCAMQHDLADASLRERQNSARDAEGKTPDEWLVDYPIARRAWPTWKKRPLKVARRPFVEPPAPTTAQRGGDVARPDGWIPTLYRIFRRLRPIPADGKPARGDEGLSAVVEDIIALADTLRPNVVSQSRSTWGPDTLRTVHAAMVSARLDRSTLLAGIPTDLASSLPRADNPSAQLMRDMMMLKDVRMSDGSTPLREYIANAAHHCRGQRQEVVFREAMAALDA